MHEWGLTCALVRELERVAAAHGAAKIVAAKVRLVTGAGVSVEHLLGQFAIAAAGTAAEGAQLEIDAATDSTAAGTARLHVESIEVDD